MTDNELVSMVGAKLRQVMPLPVVAWRARYQPTQQGRPTATTVYAHIIGHKRYGWRDSASKWDAGTGKFVVVETQSIETTLQINASVLPSTDANSLTASDILRRVAGAMQSDSFIAAIFPHAQILRVTDIRTPYMINGTDNFEISPSFDIVARHTDQWVDGVQAVTAWDFEVIPL